MKIKTYLACLAAALMLCTALTGCSDKSTQSSAAEPVTEAETETETETETVPETEAETVKLEPANAAEPGQAYLAITDSQWWVQYWGAADDKGSMLAYNAGIADIKGNGQYTVSVTCDTNGFRVNALHDPEGEYKCSGLGFAAVIIKDAETVLPDAIITIDKVAVDGKEIPMTAKNFTNTEDGAIRSNIFNEWVSAPGGDARCADGYLYADMDTEQPVLNIAEYSAQIVSRDAFTAWTTVEVTFTISGLEEEAGGGEEETVEISPEETAETASEESTEAETETTEETAE